MPTVTSDRYPVGTTVALIDGVLVTPPTAVALCHRLELPEPPTPAVLDAPILALVASIAARLVPQTGATTAIDLAGTLHRRLADGIGVGWRYADLPPALAATRHGLAALDASAVAMFGGGFAALDGDRQDDVLRALQSGRIGGDSWSGMNPVRWFHDLLAALVDIYYSHPAALDEIGYAGFADARGWQDVGFGARRSHEPEPLVIPS